MHGFDGGFDVSVCCQHDGWWHIARIAQFLQESEAIEPRHVEIGHNDVGREVGKFYQGVLAVACRLCTHAPSRNHGGQAGALGGFIIDNEYFHLFVQFRSPLARPLRIFYGSLGASVVYLQYEGQGESRQIRWVG